MSSKASNHNFLRKQDSPGKHRWGSFRDHICCEKCGYIQNSTNKDGVCKGPVFVILRKQ